MQRPSNIRSAPSPHLPQSKYFREMDKVCAEPLNADESAWLDHLRGIARTSGLGGPHRKDYALLSQCPT